MIKPIHSQRTYLNFLPFGSIKIIVTWEKTAQDDSQYFKVDTVSLPSHTDNSHDPSKPSSSITLVSLTKYNSRI